jgi:hypothetical protein
MADKSRRRPSDPPQLSYDVYRLIVDEVAADREFRPFLKNLSLAQKFLVPLCQQHLFERLEYRTRNLERLIFLNNVSPHLIAYIRGFYYTFSGNDPIVVQFIRKLTCINSFLFSRGSHDRRDSRDFRVLEPPLIKAIYGILYSSDLRWLSLNKADNYPMESLLHLGNAPNLRFLEIRELETSDNDTEPIDIQSSNAPSAPLSSLHICPRSSEVVTLLLGGPASSGGNQPVFDFPSIRELDVEGDSEADTYANKLLIQACTGVEVLTCTSEYYDLDFQENFQYLFTLYYTVEEEAHMDFEGFAGCILSGPAQTLRSLHFQRAIPWITPEDDFCGIREEIQQLSDSHKLNVLESLEITLGIYNAEPTAGEAKRICEDAESWAAELDDIFGEDCGFPSLREVSIWVTISCVPHREYKYNKKVRTRVNKIYKATAKKIKEECFDNLSGLSFDFDMEHDWDLTDWDMGR